MSRFLTLLLGAFIVAPALSALPRPAPAAAQDGYIAPPWTCSRNSECGSPLVCMSGRCRTECVENRDCNAGAHCVLNAASQGSCVLDSAGGYVPPDAPYCTAARDCTSGACSRTNQCSSS